MCEKIDSMFRERLMNEVYMKPDEIERIIKIRKKTFSILEEYFNKYFANFSNIENILIKECTAFDRKTELRSDEYGVELFINFHDNNFIVKKSQDGYIITIVNSNFKVLTNGDNFNSDMMLGWINEALPESELDMHNNNVKISEDNVKLLVIPSIFVRQKSEKYYLIPKDDIYWKRVDVWYNGNYEKRVIDNILLLKHWMRCQGFVKPELENYLEKSVIDFFDNHDFKEYLYLDFNTLLKFINKNISNELDYEFKNVENKTFKQLLKESIGASDKIISLTDGEDAIKCFESIFGISKR